MFDRSWTDFVEPILETQDNLHVVTMTRVDEVLLNNGNNKAIGVKAYNRGTFKTINYYARQEVIISAGSYDTPKLLQLSGIGDCDELSNVGIDCKVNIPGVGKNLRDHFILTSVMSPIIDNTDFISSSRIPFNYLYWGAYAINENGDYLHGMLYLPIVESESGNPLESVWALAVAAIVNHPTSVGSVTLQDNDVTSKPIIDHNFLNTQFDKDLVVDALNISRKLAYESGAFDDIMLGETNQILPPYSFQTYDELLGITQANVGIFSPGGHPIGTSKMGNENDMDNNGDDGIVVNEKLQVRGINNLRIIDASIMPDCVSANTNAMSMVIGLKGARMILEDA